MSDEEWAKSVATFQGVVDNEASDDRSIQLAWDTLRRDYKNKFNAKVSAHSTQQNEEPFGIWAAEKLSEQILERVLCLVFRKDLAECDHMSLLRSTAAKANTTVWHMLLYFGASMFSESMLSKVRKRLRVFELDPVTGVSTFKTAYLKALQATAKRTKVVLDTTSVAASNPVRVFISTDLAAMASANPEFDPPTRKTGGATGSSQAQGQGARHSVAAEEVLNMAKAITEVQKTRNSGGSASTQGRQDGLHLATEGGETIKPSIEFNIPDRQPDRAAQFLTASRLLRSESEGQRSYLPSVAPMTRPNALRGTSTRRNPPRKGRPGPMYVGVAPTDTGEAPVRNDENAVDLEIKTESSSISGTSRSTGEEPPTRVGSTIHCAPDMLQATSKRPLTVQDSELSTPNKGGSKRPKQTPTRSDLMDRGGDWDDETVLTILKQLESTCHAEYLVVDGMSDDDLSTRNQLTGEAAMRGSLLIPLKLATGQRLLVVVELNPLGKPGRGVLRYYDPNGPPDEDAVTEYAPAGRLAPLLSHFLPDRGLDRALWKSEYCVCPELSCEQDSGLSICLGAIYAVGGRPLPEMVDWMFWRHLMIGAFFSDDAAVQLRITRYRGETVHKLIRQGQMSDAALVPQGRRVSSDIEYLGTAAMNPVDRIECRADNAKKTIEVIHEGCRIFHDLQEKVDMAKADLKTRRDKNTHIRDSLRRKLNVGDQIVLGAQPTKVEQDDDTAEDFDRLTLQQAIEEHGICNARLEGLSASSESVRQALHELGIWRREVNAAVLEDDASILDKRAS